VTGVLGVLGPIESILTEALVWFHESGGLSWAWSIVAVTIAVRMLLVPLAVKQIHSMQSLQIHAPEMKAIQQRYKHDRQKQSEELMKFYRENKINPYASCLPIVFQIPIFFALFFVLRDFEEEVFCSDELGGQAVCQFNADGPVRALPEFESRLEWLDLVTITDDVGGSAASILLVVIYVVSQLSSTYLMSTSMQSAAQRWMIMLLPIAFVPFLFSIGFPNGLMIYWLTTNLWTAGQGIVTRRLMPKPVAAPPKRSSRTPPREAAAAAREEPASDGATGSTAPVRQGPPRRVKRKKGGGGRRR
jgi:YidC/Oxa1 family membrane protein insertase